MSKVLKTKHVKSVLEEHGLLTGPLADWERYKSLASAIVVALDGGRVLTSSQIESLVSKVTEGPTNSSNARAKVTRLLEAGKRAGLWESPLPSRTTVKPRVSAAPVSASQHIQRSGAHDLERYFRKYYFKHGLGCETALLGAALLLVTRVGAAESVVYGVLANLRKADFDKQTHWVNTPSHPAVSQVARYRIRLPEPLAGLLRWQSRRIPRRSYCWFFVGSLNGEASDELPDAEQIKGAIGSAYKQLVKSYQADVGDLSSPVPRTFLGFVGAGRHRARDLGLAPQFLTLMAGYPLPVSPSHIRLLEDEPLDATGRHPIQPETQQSVHYLNNADETGSVPSSLPNNFDWIGFVRNELDAFLCQIRPFCAVAGGITREHEDEVYALLIHFDNRASAVLHNPNILRVLLRFSVSRLLEHGVKHSSLKDTVSLCCARELLAEPACLDLSNWDVETVLELSEIFMSQYRRYAASTQQAATVAWRSLLNFAHSRGIGNFPRVTAHGLMSLPAGRADILTPKEAEWVHWRLQHLHGVATRKQLMLASAFSLGIHAGLRASEVINLTLKNIVVEGNEAYLYIPRGKTRNSRRQLWLHALLPRKELETLVEYVSLRSGERGQGYRLDQFYLFGAEDSHEPLGRRLVIDELIPKMSNVLGRTVDFHLLRHSFCSWLLAQAYLMENQSIGDQLGVIDHRLTDPASLASLARYLKYVQPLSQKNASTQPDIWNRVAMVMGHSSPLTLMTTYAHTLGPIQSIFLGKTSEWVRRDRL